MAEEAKVKTNAAADKKKKQKGRFNTIKGIEFWSLVQKKKLLSLLYEYPLDAYRNIANRISGKNEEQVKEFIDKIKRQIKNNQKWKNMKKSDRKAPLDEWLDVASDLVELEIVDASTNLSKVLSIISNFEDFEMPPSKDDDSSPNYKSIYKYLSQVLLINRSEDMEILGPIESAIVIDMLHGLMDVLSEFDTAVQRNIMKWKYQLLEARDQRGFPIAELQKRASENDFTEFIEEARMLRHQDRRSEMRYVARKNRKDNGEKSKDMQSSGVQTASGESSRKTSTAEGGKSPAVKSAATTSAGGDDASTSYDDTLQITEKNPESESEAGIEPGTSESSKPTIKRHKPGRKGAMDPPVVPYTEIVLVMPPKGVEIINYNPRTKKNAKERLDGKYQSLNPDEELVTNDLSREITYDVHRTKLDQFIEKHKLNEQTPSKENVSENIDDRYDGVMKKAEETENDIPVKKPKLYSINPYCVPVTFLDLKASNSLKKY